MIVDALQDPPGPELRSRVCVIGSGAAGLSAALRLTSHTDGVMLVEAGGKTLNGPTQRLYSGRNIGLPYYDLLACRLRYYGGTTNHWSGYCRDNDPIDYEGRPDLGVPAWPIRHADVAPYISQAAAMLKISDKFDDPAAIFADAGFEDAPLVEGLTPMLETKTFQLTQVRKLAQEFAPQLTAAPGLTRTLNLNAVEVVLTERGDAVDHIVARTLDGAETRLRADAFVLCCHAIENARLLLNSDRQRPEGVGNAHGHVGRYFMEHPHLFASRMIPSGTFPLSYDYDWARESRLNANLSLTAQAMRETGALSYYCRFTPVSADDGVAEAVQGLRQGFFKPFHPDLIEDIGTLMRDLDGASNLIWSRLHRHRPQALHYLLEHRIEQAPNPDSRIVLSTARDAFGMRQADLDWRLNDLDIHTFAAGQEMVARELSALGWGRFELESIDRPLVEARAEGHYHHIGTTRMSERPEDGVVNADCRVHGLDNLYVGGSGVFTTAGYSGPTMVIMALALRMADHIGTQLS